MPREPCDDMGMDQQNICGGPHAKRSENQFPSRHDDPTYYWDQRARKYGARAVLNLRHSESEFSSVTQRQKNILYPLFRGQLRGFERSVLDLGCGPGRFTIDLAKMVHGKAVGIDPTEELLHLAPSDQNVKYLLGDAARIPLNTHSVDVVWICMVLGGLRDLELNQAANQIQRVLRPGGLLFLVENTSKLPSRAHWHFRSVKNYRLLFPQIGLRHIGQYHDVGEEVSIMAGRNGLNPCGEQRLD